MCDVTVKYCVNAIWDQFAVGYHQFCKSQFNNCAALKWQMNFSGRHTHFTYCLTALTYLLTYVTVDYSTCFRRCRCCD